MTPTEDKTLGLIERMAFESLGWTIDDRRQIPADTTEDLIGVVDDGEVTIYAEGAMQTAWITSDYAISMED